LSAENAPLAGTHERPERPELGSALAAFAEGKVHSADVAGRLGVYDAVLLAIND
jgi:hypothetical protein